MSDTNSVMVIEGREIEGYKASMPVLIASSDNDTRLLLIARAGADFGLPGGFITDNYLSDRIPEIDPAIAEGLLALYADREIGEYAIPVTFDYSGSMPDELLRSMLVEVQSIMVDYVPIEMSQRDIDARLTATLGRSYVRDIEPMRISNREMIEEMTCLAPIMPRERPDHGAPRSIRETRRAQGRGKRASAMRGWKRK